MKSVLEVLNGQGRGTVPTCGPRDDVASVHKTMLENNMTSIAVVDDGRLLGVVSHGEITIAVGEGDSGVYADGKFMMGTTGK